MVTDDAPFQLPACQVKPPLITLVPTRSPAFSTSVGARHRAVEVEIAAGQNSHAQLVGRDVTAGEVAAALQH